MMTSWPTWAKCLDKDFAGVKASTHSSKEQGHGRMEERQVIAVPVPEGFSEPGVVGGL